MESDDDGDSHGGGNGGGTGSGSGPAKKKRRRQALSCTGKLCSFSQPFPISRGCGGIRLFDWGCHFLEDFQGVFSSVFLSSHSGITS
jgi:hypothetical protein